MEVEPDETFPEDVWRLIISRINHVKQLSLQILSKKFSRIIPEEVTSLFACNHFQSLDLLKFPSLTNLNLYGDTVIEDWTLSMNALSSLRILSLQGNKKITNWGLCRMTQLTTLTLMRNTIISEEALMGLTNLTKLNLSMTIGIRGDVCLSLLTNLTDLDISASIVQGDLNVRTLTNLTRLNIRKNRYMIQLDLAEVRAYITHPKYKDRTDYTSALFYLPNLKYLESSHKARGDWHEAILL